MLIHQIHPQMLHLSPKVIELLPLRIRSRTSNNLYLRINFTNSINKWLKTNRIFFAPLFIADAYILQVEWLRMSHVGTHFPPPGIRTSVGELYQIQCILYITIQLIHRLMRTFICILELAS